MNYIIIAAGGKGTRMHQGFNRDPRTKVRGSLILAPVKGQVAQNKIFAKLGKFPIIYWTLSVFEKSKTIDKVLISVGSSDIPKLKQIVKKFGFKKVAEFIPASESRQSSTLDILESIKGVVRNGDLVGVHNGVNPFVSEDELGEVFKAAKKYGAALLAQKARDTVKITNGDGRVANTPLRQYVWYAQTPQVATFENLYKAHVKSRKDGFVGTDDAQLLERIGIAPKIVETSNQNFKITFAEDLAVARFILKKFLVSSRT